MWVVQELALAREVELRWQSITMTWVALRSFIASVLESDKSDVLAKAVSSAFESNEWLVKPLPIQDFFKPNDDQNELIDLVVRYENHACSISSDHVFGLLGLAEGGQDFRVDYVDTPTALIAKIILAARRGPTNEQLEVLRRLLLGNFTAPYRFDVCELDILSQKVDGEDVRFCSSCLRITSQSHGHWLHAAMLTVEPLKSFIIFKKPLNILQAASKMNSNALRQASSKVSAIAISGPQTPDNPQPELHLFQVPSTPGRIRLVGDIRDGKDIRHVVLEDNWLALAVVLMLVKAATSHLEYSNCELARKSFEDLFNRKCQEYIKLQNTDSELGRKPGNRTIRTHLGINTLT